MPNKLSQKQDMFCREYIIDLNATQAAIRAGYSKKTANRIGPENLSKLVIQEKLSELIGKRLTRVEITADTVLRECMRIALADVGQAFKEDGSLKDIHDIPEDIRRAISGFEVIEEFDTVDNKQVHCGWLKKVKFWSKDKNVEVLFKHLGMFEMDNVQKTDSERSKYKDMTLDELLKLKKLLSK